MKKRLEKEKLLGLLQTKQNMAESVSKIWCIFAKIRRYRMSESKNSVLHKLRDVSFQFTLY